jgi:hypothetical protein
MMDFYLDENLSEYVADALNFLNKGYFQDVQVFSTKIKPGKGLPDEDVIPWLGKADGILVTRDLHISKTQLQFALCKQYNLGVFFLRLPKNQNKHWEIIKLLINNWEEMIVKTEKEHKPFAYVVHVRGRMEKL